MQNQEHDSPLKKISRGISIDLSILDVCSVTEEEITAFSTGIVEELHANLFYAFLCQLTTFISTPIIVFSPDYSIVMQENGKEGLSVKFYGNKENYHISIIPVKIDDYFGIAIFEKGASIHFYDPFYNDITPETRKHLRTVVQGIVESDSIVKVYQTKSALFNKATTTNEATIICCIIVQRFLIHSKRTYIENFNIQKERDEIITKVLATILTGKKLNLEDFNSNEQGSYKSWHSHRIREEETIEERENRLRIDKEQKRFSRQIESDDEIEMRQSSDRIRYKQTCERRKNTVYLQGRQTDDDVSEHRLNSLDITCIHCGALHFPEEATTRNTNSFNDCCRSKYYYDN
jgi:hypothetical protein